ncbi:MAG: BolA family transcriptional regulator [Gammaproteobacteria bacterium]|nr:BolA family transcriptional regulator [Gammaproteobacteria bacterium]
MDRIAAIRDCLTQRFTPQQLDIGDDSALHAGHAGAASGAGHYRVHIVSPAFRGMSPLARHRAVYDAVSELMGREIHALSIQARSPEEPSPGKA